MFDLISQYNPFKRSKTARQQAAKDERIAKMEKVNKRIDERIINKRNNLIQQAEELEATVKGMLENYDEYRQK